MGQIKLTPRIQKAIVESVRHGEAITSACAKAGLDKSTAHQWWRTGSDDALRFKSLVEQAKAEYESKMVAAIRNAANGKPDRTVKTTVRQVVEMQEVRSPDGTVTKTPVVVELKTTETITSTKDDWRAAESWLTRQNWQEWKPKEEIESKSEIRVIYEDGDRNSTAEVSSGADANLAEPEAI